MWQTGILGGVNKITPGPGKYDLGTTLSQTKYTMRPKTQEDFMILNKFVPGKSNFYNILKGPGTYTHQPAINPVGKYNLSQYNNSCATLFNPPRSMRFKELKGSYFISNFFLGKEVPGPGNYKVENTGIQKVNLKKNLKFRMDDIH